MGSVSWFKWAACPLVGSCFSISQTDQTLVAFLDKLQRVAFAFLPLPWYKILPQILKSVLSKLGILLVSMHTTSGLVLLHFGCSYENATSGHRLMNHAQSQSACMLNM